MNLFIEWTAVLVTGIVLGAMVGYAILGGF